MAIPRPKDDLMTYAPRPDATIGAGVGESLIPSYVAPGQGAAFSTRGGDITNFATNSPTLGAQLPSYGFQQTARPQTGSPAELLNMPRPVNTGPALSDAQQAFLRGDRVAQASSPMATPVQMAEQARARRAEETQGRKDFALELRGAPAKIAAQSREEVARIREAGDMAVTNAKIGSAEKIQGARDIAAMERENLKAAVASNNAQEQIKSRERIAKNEIAASASEMVAKGLKVGSPEWEQAQNAKLQALQAEGIIQNQAQADQIKRQGLVDLAQTAFKAVYEFGASVSDKEKARTLMTDAQAALDAPVAGAEQTTVAPQGGEPVATPTPMPDQSGTSDLDGSGDLSPDEQLYDNFATALKTTTSEAKKLQIQNAMKQLKDRILGSK